MVPSSNISHNVEFDQIKASCVEPGHLAYTFSNFMFASHTLKRSYKWPVFKLILPTKR